ncbi:MAG: M67 family metallopeptidase [Acidobacteriota bacterium]
MDHVRIRAPLVDEMVQHALRDAPWECCGLLAGKATDITVLKAMANVLQSPVRYAMESKALLLFFKELRTQGLRHLGIYHSHPSSEAYPSATDVSESFYPECSYFIVSLRTPESPQVRAFSITDGRVSEQRIELIP